jgi:hypothetical protein
MSDLPSRTPQETRKLTSTMVFVLSLLIMAVVAARLGYGVLDSWRWEDRQGSWASTYGLIEAASVQERVGRRVSWETSWTYSYSVNGKSYQARSNALAHAYVEHRYGTEQEAQGNILTRPVGSTVAVLYDPAAPKLSVLDPAKHDALDWLSLGLSGLSWIVVILGAYWLLTHRKPRTPNK